MSNTKSRRGKKKSKIMKEKDWTEKVDVLLGDGNAVVGKSRTIKHGLEFGAFAISDTTTVHLKCNQDLKTIKRAHKAARQLVERFQERDAKTVNEIFQAAVEAYKSEEG